MSPPRSPPGFHVSIADSAAEYTPVQYSFNSKILTYTIIVVFLVVFFILMVLRLCARWFLQGSSRSYTIRRGIPVVLASAHITPGLDKATIAQLPTFVYKAVDNLEAGKLDESVAQPSLECAVCLSEFQENEKCRMLPSCKHTFHTECIDMWFLSHSTCPLCRTKVGLAMGTLPQTASTVGEEQEGMEPSPSTAEGNAVVINVVEYPGNVLLWGNQTHLVSGQEPSSSSFPSSRPLRMSGARVLTIDILPIEGNLLVSTSGPLSAQCTTEQEACSSQPLKSPGFRTSIKRMLSRQSSRQKSPNQEVYEGSAK